MKTGQNTWFRDFHARTILAPPDTGHDWKALSYFAVTHGGVPDEPAAFARAAARWGSC